MANPIKGEVAFVIEGGQTYTVQFTIDAICTLEDLQDKSINQIAAQMAGGRLSVIRAVLWAGLLEHHKGLTLKQVGELMPLIRGDQKPLDIVNEALRLAFAPDDDGKAGEPDADPQ